MTNSKFSHIPVFSSLVDYRFLNNLLPISGLKHCIKSIRSAKKGYSNVLLFYVVSVFIVIVHSYKSPEAEGVLLSFTLSESNGVNCVDSLWDEWSERTTCGVTCEFQWTWHADKQIFHSLMVSRILVHCYGESNQSSIWRPYIQIIFSWVEYYLLTSTAFGTLWYIL